jgi:hypothetical protein
MAKMCYLLQVRKEICVPGGPCAELDLGEEAVAFLDWAQDDCRNSHSFLLKQRLIMLTTAN